MMAEVSLAEWKRFLEGRPGAHILQTGEWGELKGGFGWEPVRMISGEAGIQILFRKLPLGFTFAYAPKPVFSDQLSLFSDQLSVFSDQLSVFSGQFLKEMDSVCRKRRAIFLKIEPDLWDDALAPHRLPPFSEKVGGEKEGGRMKVSPRNIQPPRTILVDLRGSEDEILARMKQKTRYNIRLAEKKGVTVRPWDDLPAFHNMLLLTGGRDNFGVHSLEYYRRAYELFQPAGMAELLAAEYEGRPLAALMVFARGRRAWYLFGASTDEHRNLMPTYLLQWEAMKWARAKGAEEYDLWGVPDEDEAALEANFETRRDGLWGVYRFKRGFGGVVKRAAQAVDRVYNPLLYQLYLRWMAGRERG